MRNFTTWLAGFRSAIAGYKYYTDFEKIYKNNYTNHKKHQNRTNNT